MSFCVVVRFDLRPGAAAAFLPLMTAQAETSRAVEPGCRRFDVWTDPARPDAVFLYEIYDDRAAFEAHLSSPHFRDFDARTAAMVAAKAVDVWAAPARCEP